MRSMTPFLMFEGRAEEAMDYYMETFEDAEIRYVKKYEADTPEMEGKIMQGVIRIHDQMIMMNDSNVPHEFSFTPSMSFFIECNSQPEIDRYYKKLKKKGAILMPMDDYGFSDSFAWVQDQFGVSWQLNLS